MVRRRAMAKTAAYLLICALALGAFAPAARADVPASAPLTAGATQNGMVRVRLSSLGSPAALNLTVYGSYTVNGQTDKTLSSGSSVTVRYNAASGSLSLTAGGVTASMGSAFKLRRHQTGGQNGVKIAQGRVPGNLYPGDFQFTVKNGVLYIIAYIYMEDYLYGVLPYEMGASSPLESLKAQAIAARTYTMRAMAYAASSLYDVVDTTADQVYNGTPSGSAACVRAVDETRGIALRYASSFAAAYYTASNGGQTESIKNAWGVSGYPYLSVKDDPYDLASPDARKASFFVSAAGTQSNGILGNLLSRKAQSVFGSGAAVTAVTAVTPHSPKYAAPSKLYTKLDFSVAYQRGGAAYTGVLTFDIFSELEGPLGMSINSGSNELWSAAASAGGFTVTARRYGHGLGMSQRGAMQMAKMGYSCAQILGFYFEGCTQMQYTLTRSILSPVISGQPSQEQYITEAPAPLQTDAPTVAPSAPAGGLYARVTTAQGSLNLRESPRSSARVLRTIPQYETIAILEKGDAWCKTAYGGLTGYVMTGFLTFQTGTLPLAPTDMPSAAPTQAPTAPAGGLYARVTTAQGSLNLRESPRSNARVLRTIPQYETIAILEKGDAWCKTAYGGLTGYVMTGFLTFQTGALPLAPTDMPSAAPTQAPTASAPTAAPVPVSGDAVARVVTPQGSLNLREGPRNNARIIRTIPQYDFVTVLSAGTEWCQVAYSGETGFVMARFLSFGASAAPTLAPSAPAPTAAPVPVSGDAVARVVTVQGSLNLRQSPGESARVLRTIPQYGFVTVQERGSVWCRVTYDGTAGWAMTRFLSFGAGTAASPAPSAAPVSSPAGQQTDPTLRALDMPVMGRVMPEDKRLNLRQACSTSARVILEMPKYDFLLIIAVGDTWCEVEYEGKHGYCMTKYLEYTLYE